MRIIREVGVTDGHARAPTLIDEYMNKKIYDKIIDTYETQYDKNIKKN